MPNLKELQEERAKLVPEIRELADKANDKPDEYTSEDEQKWERLNSQYDEYTQKIEREQRVSDLESEQHRHAEEARQVGREDYDGRSRKGRERAEQELPTEEDRMNALQGWLRVKCDREPEERHVEAAAKCGVRLNAREFTIPLARSSNYRKLQAEARAISTGAGTGGETIPEGFVNQFERALLAFGGMRQVAEVMRTDSGNDLPWPTTDDTSNKGAILGENTQVGEQDITTSNITWGAYKYTSKLIRVSAELMEDSAFNLVQLLPDMLAERIGRITNEHFTVGDDNDKPEGIVEGAVSGVTAAATGSLDADEIIDLVHSIDPAYRQMPGVRFMLHDDVLKAVRKLKDNDGQYLWQPGMQDGTPPTIFGFPYTINQDMASSIAASAKVIVFGDLQKYKIRDVASLRMYRLEERYRDFDQDAFVGFTRHDGRLLDAGTNPVKYMEMAAS